MILIGFVSFFVSPASSLTVYAGDTVELSGGASGADYVYLFLSGPNLPSGGVSLDDISSAVVTGDASSFTRVSVKNNLWKYKWDTQSMGGTLSPGNYVVYAVNSPSGRKDLSGEEYSYTQISLIDPSVSAYISTKTTETMIPVILETDTLEVKATENNTSADENNSLTDEILPLQTQESGICYGLTIIALIISIVLVIRVGKR